MNSPRPNLKLNPNPAARPDRFSANELSPLYPENSSLKESGTTGYVGDW